MRDPDSATTTRLDVIKLVVLLLLLGLAGLLALNPEPGVAASLLPLAWL